MNVVGVETAYVPVAKPPEPPGPLFATLSAPPPAPIKKKVKEFTLLGEVQL